MYLLSFNREGAEVNPPFNQPLNLSFTAFIIMYAVFQKKHFNMLTFWPNKSWSYNQSNQLYIAFSFGTIIIINFLVVQSDFAAFWYPLIFFLFFPNYWFFFLSRPFWRSSTIARFSCHVSFVRQQNSRERGWISAPCLNGYPPLSKCNTHCN